jgi:hypothetical protein
MRGRTAGERQSDWTLTAKSATKGFLYVVWKLLNSRQGSGLGCTSLEHRQRAQSFYYMNERHNHQEWPSPPAQVTGVPEACWHKGSSTKPLPTRLHRA